MHSDVCFKNLRHRESWKQGNNCTSLFTPLKDDSRPSYQERLFQTSGLKVQFQLSAWWISSDLNPSQNVPNSLKTQKKYIDIFTLGNRWLGGICSSPHREPKVTWEGQEPKQRSCFPFSQNRKASTLLDWKQSGTSSTNIQFLWAPSPGAPVNLLASAINQRDIIREKTNLLICFVNEAAWSSGRALGSTCHAARSHVDGLRVGVNLQERKENQNASDEGWASR